MDLTNEEIQRFIEAWEKDFGERLTPEQARIELTKLLFFLQKLYEAQREEE